MRASCVYKLPKMGSDFAVRSVDHIDALCSSRLDFFPRIPHDSLASCPILLASTPVLFCASVQSAPPTSINTVLGELVSLVHHDATSLIMDQLNINTIDSTNAAWTFMYGFIFCYHLFSKTQSHLISFTYSDSTFQHPSPPITLLYFVPSTRITPLPPPRQPSSQNSSSAPTPNGQITRYPHPSHYTPS